MHAVLVTPLSGPLARLGRDTAEALALWARRVARPSVSLDVIDAHPNAARGMRAAVDGRPDLVFGPYGSGSALAAIRATDRLVWNHGGATTRLRWQVTPNAINVLAPASTYLHGAIQALRSAGLSDAVAIVLYAQTGFGRDVGQGAAAEAHRFGWTVSTAGLLPGEAGASATSPPHGDVLLLAGGWDDELAAARGLLGRPWRAVAMVAAGEADLLVHLGARREGLLGPAQWLPAAGAEPDIGPSASWFLQAFRLSSGRDPTYPAAQAFAAGLLAGHCVATAGCSDDVALRSAAIALDVTTLFGRFRLDHVTGLQAGHRVFTVQWQKGTRRIVWPPDRAETALRLPP